MAGYKVIILNPAEAMNANASNALLKNLEEPAGRTVFVLVSEDPSRLMPTIRSRCSKIRLPMPEADSAQRWLSANGVEGDLQELLVEAQGAPLLAQSLHASGQFATRKQLLGDLLAVRDRRLEPMVFAGKWSREEPMSVLAPMMNSVEFALAERIGGRECPPHYASLCRSLTAIPPPALFSLRGQLCRKKAEFMRSSNLNGALGVEALSLDWAGMGKF